MILLAASAAMLPATAYAQAGAQGGGHRMGPPAMHNPPATGQHPGMRGGTWHGGTIGGPACGGTGCGNWQGGGGTWSGGGNWQGGGGTWHGGGGRHHRFTRINRGGTIPGFWFGPQFHIMNWGMYGFSQPRDDERWVRYYDDAYLIGRDGRVRDGRHDMDWDRYGERWADDENGVPYYVGNGDFEPGDYDYEWAERYEREHGRDDYARRGHGRGDRGGGDVRVHVGGGGHGGYGYNPPMPAPGYGYGGGYGYGAYGYGWGWGPVLVTETIVTTAPVVETHTYYETVTERVRVKPKARGCRCARPAPRPRAGERG
ncbi:MAG TPA: RcnB family protein [Allosphingosinicella sp.]